jgi:hypothetical protein
VVHFCVDHLGVSLGEPIRIALYDPHPAISAIWNAPPQARPLAEVVDELLDVLSRPEELRAAGSWSYSATAIGPPRPISLEQSSCAEVIDSFFQPLRPRERRMVEMRYGPLDGTGATLAEIGSEFGLTRERVRQILHACLQRLSADAELRRRRLLTEFLLEITERAGGLIHERDLARAACVRLAPPHPECGPFLRTLLETDPRTVSAGRGVWASANVSLESVASLRECFRAALRAAGKPLHREELLHASHNGREHPDSLLLGCLKTDERLWCQDGERFGLIEWQWLLPETQDDYVYLSLRAAGRPRHYLWITDYVNTLVAAGCEVTAREIHSTLLERSDRFLRVREGTYGLLEWSSPGGQRSDAPAGSGQADASARSSREASG